MQMKKAKDIYSNLSSLSRGILRCHLCVSLFGCPNYKGEEQVKTLKCVRKNVISWYSSPTITFTIAVVTPLRKAASYEPRIAILGIWGDTWLTRGKYGIYVAVRGSYGVYATPAAT